MPRPKNNSLLALFKTNDLDQIVCYNEKCDGKVLYQHSANLERHLKLLHPLIYSSYIKKKTILKFPRKLNFEKRLIDLVREYPILWNKFNEFRFNEGLTNKAWKEISYKLEVTVRTCKMRWENLAEKFKSELILFPQNPSQVGTAKSKHPNSKSKWKYFPELLFLCDHLNLTQNPPQAQPDTMEHLKLDDIKEETSESFLQYNETLEDSSQFEFGDESMVNDDLEDSTQMDENGDSRPQDDREASGSRDIVELADTPSETSEGPWDNTRASGPQESREKEKNQRYASQNNTDQSAGRATTPNETEGKFDLDNLEKLIESMKENKEKLIPERVNENGIANELDPDRMFLLSLWPFLKAIPDRKKLHVRHRIQGVLLEEQEHPD